MRREKYRKLFFGIKKKAILSISLIFGIAYFLTYQGINMVAKNNILDFLTDQYTYINENITEAFDSIYAELDGLTADFIVNDYVQKTMTNRPLDAADEEMMERTLSYYNESFLDSYLVIDNKGNLYSPKKVSLNLDKFKRSDICKGLGTEYSKTKLLWERDTIFGTNEMALFAVRYIHEMNSEHDAGILILKLNDMVLNPVRESIRTPELAHFILTHEGEICFRKIPEDMGNEWKESIDHDQEGLKDGIVSRMQNEKTGYTIITYAPGSVTNQIINKIQKILMLIFGAAYLLTILLITLFTDKLTEPIIHLSSVMKKFDHSRLNETVSIDTNTELDYIGSSYNKMLASVKTLMGDVRKKEKELKDSEMQTLLYQIRPHFLYNTLDTIYMLARIQKEETIMKMTQSLSKFLRINLSNGKESIEVWEELEHVSSYMEIQKVRNADLFEYEIRAEREVEHLPVSKMILQPIVENSIKHGFKDFYEGGKIWIRAYEENGYLCFSIENNGTPIDDEALEKLNSLERVSMDDVDKVIAKRQGGFGICNVVKRLRLRYDEQIRFYYVRKEHGTECVIKIKKRTNQ